MKEAKGWGLQLAMMLCAALFLLQSDRAAAQSTLPSVTVNGVTYPAQDWWYWYYQRWGTMPWWFRPSSPSSPTSVPIPLAPEGPIYVEPLDAICQTISRPISWQNGGGHADYLYCCADGTCQVTCGPDYPADPGFPPVGCGEGGGGTLPP